MSRGSGRFGLGLFHLFLVVLVPLHTLTAEAETSLGVGAEYTRGDYGTGIETTAWKFPFALEYRGLETLFSLTVPYWLSLVL